MDKRDLYLKVLAVVKELQKDKLEKAIDNTYEDLKKAKGSEKERRRIAAFKEDKARGIPKFKDMGTYIAPNRPHEGHEFGINQQMPNSKEGTSVVGHHIKEKTDPVIPVKEQMKDKLKHLMSAPKPNLPKTELEKAKGSEKSDKEAPSDPNDLLEGIFGLKNPRNRPEYIKIQEEKAKAAKGKKMKKADNKDPKEDAKLGEDIENLVEQHMLENKDKEKQEGHEIMKSKNQLWKNWMEKCMKSMQKSWGDQNLIMSEKLKKPYRSEAQRGKFHAMKERGEISPATVKEWDKASKGKKLPEKVKKVDPKTALRPTLVNKANSQLDKAVTRDEHEIGIHNVLPIYEQGKGVSHGRSYAGQKVRQVSSGRGTPEISGIKAKALHAQKLREIISMAKPNLPKTELEKDGGTASFPTSRIDSGFGKVIVKKELEKQAAPAPAPMPKPAQVKMPKIAAIKQPSMNMGSNPKMAKPKLMQSENKKK